MLRKKKHAGNNGMAYGKAYAEGKEERHGSYWAYAQLQGMAREVVGKSPPENAKITGCRWNYAFHMPHTYIHTLHICLGESACRWACCVCVQQGRVWESAQLLSTWLKRWQVVAGRQRCAGQEHPPLPRGRNRPKRVGQKYIHMLELSFKKYKKPVHCPKKVLGG